MTLRTALPHAAAVAAMPGSGNSALFTKWTSIERASSIRITLLSARNATKHGTACFCEYTGMSNGFSS